MTSTETSNKEAQAEQFLTELRNKTSPMHRALEATALSSAIMKNDLTALTYRRYLTAMAAVIEWHERTVSPVLGDFISNADQRKKLSSINMDLAVLVNGDHQPKMKFSLSGATPSLATAMGYTYVIEGSTLGGMMILKHLQGKTFISAETTHFFSAYGRNTGLLWKNFIASFSTYAVESGKQQEIIMAAAETFDGIRNHFNDVGLN